MYKFGTTKRFDKALKLCKKRGYPIEELKMCIRDRYEAILLPTEEASRVIEFDLKNGYDAPFVWTMPVKLEGCLLYTSHRAPSIRTASRV